MILRRNRITLISFLFQMQGDTSNQGILIFERTHRGCFPLQINGQLLSNSHYLHNFHSFIHITHFISTIILYFESPSLHTLREPHYKKIHQESLISSNVVFIFDTCFLLNCRINMKSYLRASIKKKKSRK